MLLLLLLLLLRCCVESDRFLCELPTNQAEWFAKLTRHLLAADLISGRTNGADGPAPPGRRLHQLQPTADQTTVGDVQTAEDQANADVADRVADDALGNMHSLVLLMEIHDTVHM